MNTHLKSFFYYSKSEKRGIILLFAILILLFCYWHYIANINPHVINNMNEEMNLLISQIEDKKAINEKKKWQKYSSQKRSYTKLYNSNKTETGSRNANNPLEIKKHFDPNETSIEALIAMGLPDKAANNWIKYIQNGGAFRRPEDLAKLYNLSDNHYQQLLPYIRLNKNHTTVARSNTKQTHNRLEKNIISLIDLNNAQVEDLTPIYGVGTKTAARILKYRDELGGYIDIEQLKDVWGLPESTFDHIAEQVIIIGYPNTININTANIKKLVQHPLIDYKLARSIYNYRLQHGPYADWHDVTKLHLIKGKKSLRPYLSY